MRKDKTIPAVPSFADIFSKADADEKAQLTALQESFTSKFLVGTVVTNWCERCHSWKLNYVSNERKKEGIEPGSVFACTQCKGPLPLYADDQHTVLRSE